jgi:hypothetical protein
MLSNTTNYPYSKKNGFVTIGVLVVLGLLFISNILKAYYNHDRIDLVVFIVLTLALIFVLGIVIFKRLRPALNGETALEFNDKEIVDYLRNITINWQDIESIDFKRTRSSAMLWIKLKWESDYGSAIFISLRWIEGSDSDIYSTALSYFDKFSNNESDDKS